MENKDPFNFISTREPSLKAHILVSIVFTIIIYLFNLIPQLPVSLSTQFLKPVSSLPLKPSPKVFFSVANKDKTSTFPPHFSHHTEYTQAHPPLKEANLRAYTKQL